MVFTIEALGLIDHFNFLDGLATAPLAQPVGGSPTVPADAAEASEWFLGTSDRWAAKYFAPGDLHSTDRLLFAR